jgi:hypothetical protein
MKQYSYLLIIGVVVSALLACGGGGGDDEPDPGPSPYIPDPTPTDKTSAVSFTASISDFRTRASGSSFEDRDEISVFPVVGNVVGENNRYVCNKGIFSATLGITKKESDKLAYYAVSPYSLTTKMQMDFAVQTNQTKWNQYFASDLMTATVASTTSFTPDLQFNHRMSRVCVDFVGDNASTLPGRVSRIVLKDMHLQATVDIKADEYVASGQKGNVTMYFYEDCFYGIIPPQTIPKETSFLVVTLDGQDYPIYFEEDIVFKSGYDFWIDLSYNEGEGDGQIVVFKGQISPWRK